MMGLADFWGVSTVVLFFFSFRVVSNVSRVMVLGWGILLGVEGLKIDYFEARC